MIQDESSYVPQSSFDVLETGVGKSDFVADEETAAIGAGTGRAPHSQRTRALTPSTQHTCRALHLSCANATYT